MLERLQKLQSIQRRKGFKLEGLDVLSEDTVLEKRNDVFGQPSGPEAEGSREGKTPPADSALNRECIERITKSCSESSCLGTLSRSVSLESPSSTVRSSDTSSNVGNSGPRLGQSVSSISQFGQPVQ